MAEERNSVEMTLLVSYNASAGLTIKEVANMVETIIDDALAGNATARNANILSYVENYKRG